MISMTGYGAAGREWKGTTISVEMRGVNHRYLEISMRLPRHFIQWEDQLKKEIQKKIFRGRIEVYVYVKTEQTPAKKIRVDWQLAQSYVTSMKEMQQRFGLEGSISLQDLAGREDLFIIEEMQEDVTDFASILQETIAEAVDRFSMMRREEGVSLAKDVLQRIKKVEADVRQLKEYAPEVAEGYRHRLEGRLQELWGQRMDLDESRLLAEVALFAEKSNIDEEITRLLSHCSQFYSFLQAEEPVGRKMDFLLQEMNREMNTIGSKANDGQISKLVVQAKSELEKIREQVQNIE